MDPRTKAQASKQPSGKSGPAEFCSWGQLFRPSMKHNGDPVCLREGLDALIMISVWGRLGRGFLVV